jgi:hypothetical protein
MKKAKKPKPPAAVAAKKTSGGEGVSVSVVMPPETLVALKTAAAQKTSTVRALVLDSLRKSGYPVPAHELTDRRRKA